MTHTATLVNGERYQVRAPSGWLTFLKGVAQTVASDDVEMLKSIRTLDKKGNDVPAFKITRHVDSAGDEVQPAPTATALVTEDDQDDLPEDLAPAVPRPQAPEATE